MTITDILILEFLGNYSVDHAAFQTIDAFLQRPDVCDAHKVAALHHAGSVGMGLPDVTTEQVLLDYLADL